MHPVRCPYPLLVPVIAALAPMSPAARAGAPAPFTEEAGARGIDYTVDQPQGYGQGVAFVDLDNDGDPDVVLVGRAGGQVGVYENDGTGHFIDRSATSGIPFLSSSSGISAADYDRDGRLDLYFSCWLQPNRLLHNDGNFTFSDTTAAAGVGDANSGAGCGWGDYDLDGHIDLYLANWGEPNRLYHNLGNGTFEEVAVALGVDRGDDRTFQGTFFDFDKDNDLDLYLATDKANNCSSPDRHNHLYENVGGAFVDITEQSGTAACLDAMCVALGDFDNNLFQDIYVTNTESGNALLMNEGNGTFSAEEVVAGVESHAIGWGSVFFDYDNDGIQDLYVCNTFFGDNRLYRHEGAWPCVNISGAVGTSCPGLSFACAAADIDGDGDGDLLVMNLSEPIRLYVNHEGQRRRWAKFDIVAEGQDVAAIGARVRIHHGLKRQLREVVAGSNYKSQNEFNLHFGVNSSTLLDEVSVAWPGGTTRTLANLETNQTYRIYPPQRLGDSDESGVVDFDDVDDFAAVLVGADTDPNHALLSDMNGDWTVDGHDMEGFIAAVAP